MWLQILIEAGFPAFGEAFPRKWESTIKDANPDGFYESALRHGIYYRTNPHPDTGAYFFPEQVENHVVKVFVPGLIRTDRAFIGKVIASVRPWREYEASIQRLYAMEDENRAEGSPGPPPRMPPALEWWAENFGLIRDIATRRYPVHVQSYDGLLEDPERVIRAALEWLGRGDVDKAVRAVKPENRTQRLVESDSVEPRIAGVFDRLYDTIRGGGGLTHDFIGTLNETNEELAPEIRRHQQYIRAELLRRREARRASGEPDPNGEDFDPYEP
jgi:hypothetical protein